MPSTVNTDTVDAGLVDELERLWKLVRGLRTEAHFAGVWLKDEHLAELRERIAAGKTTMNGDPPGVEGDEPIPIAEWIASDRAMLDAEFAALAWIVNARYEIEGTGAPYPIPAELAEAARKYAESHEAEKSS